MAMKLRSSSFDDGDYLSRKHALSSDFGFGCDPDAPTGSGFWHWVVVNIPSGTVSMPEGSNSLPVGAMETRTDFGKPGYGGPCPPEGDHPHRYVFTIFSLSVGSLRVEPDTSAAVVGFMLNANTIEKATLMGLHRR